MGICWREGPKSPCWLEITITQILQDERVAVSEALRREARGRLDSCPDAEGLGSSSAVLRREHDPRGNGRVYHLNFDAEDRSGGFCSGEVTVYVPHDQAKGGECVDEGPQFDSTVCDQPGVVQLSTAAPACGLGYELIGVLSVLFWMRRRVSQRG